MASNPFNSGVFSAPKYSAFPWSHGNRISMDAGKIHVIGSEYLDTGEKFDLNSIGNVTRVAPMKAPTLDTYQTDIFAFACRLRTLGMATRNPWPYEDFFNLRDNIDTSKRLPDIPLAVLFGVNRFRNNTLLENFGLPTFKNLREDYLDFLRKTCSWVFDPIVFAVVNDIPVSGGVDFQPSSFVSSSARDFTSFYFNNSSYFYRYVDIFSHTADFPYLRSLIPWLVERFQSVRDYLISFLDVDVLQDTVYSPDSVYFMMGQVSISSKFEPFNILDNLHTL